ncbi:MAG: VIT1/CCC1 transporter family protein [Thermoanaerobaculia bacterium]|nr:VIT1/CCC1 transporter family protein [Thermoanaerobaculia bacterium]
MSSRSSEALVHPPPSHRPEAWHHSGAGGLLGDLVLGSSDGLVGFLSFVAGVSASLPSQRIIVLAGVAEMFAGGTSMGLGAYLGAKSEREYYEHELAREKMEIREMPDEEREEIRQIYRGKGFEGGELEMVVGRITADKDRWLKIMMHEELGFTQSAFVSPYRAGLGVGLSYVVGAAFPLAPYLLFDRKIALVVSMALTGLVLFAVGAAKSRLSARSWLKSGVEMAGLGLAGAMFCYGLSAWIASL